MTNAKVLVVDDEPDIRELLSLTLKRMGLDCVCAADLKEAFALLKQDDFSLVLTDMRLPDGEGIDLVKTIQKLKPQLPVAVITAYGNVEGAVNALKAGAFDYVSKPVDLPMLKGLVHTALAMQNKTAGEKDGLLVGDSFIMQKLRSNIHKVARSQAPVFIHGESGVGKELVAQLIHANGPRAEKPFIPVNCGAIPGELMESEFFGHKRGSFTGAITDKQGLFLAAQGGTLFLDEIADLPLAMQVKLLRAIQEKAIKPVGELNEIAVDVRILSASHKNLLEEIKAGRFRQDLYYRINVIEIGVSPLRERMEDLGLLANYILKRLTVAHQRPLVALSADALTALKNYAFPGNVRELENILERSLALCEGDTITASDLHLPQNQVEFTPLNTETSDSKLDEILGEQEKDMILQALEKTKWNRTQAAKLLGVSFRTLRYRLKKLGID